MRIVAVHLFNDYSGSPKVLMQLLKIWEKNNKETHLFTCGTREGFLSDISGISYHHYWYQFAKNPLIRFLFLGISQMFLGVKLLFFLKKTDLVYINTILPFGAAVIGKLKGCEVIYHLHETSVKPLIFKKFLFGIAKLTASKTIYVSHFLASKEMISIQNTVLYNVLEEDFIKQANEKNTFLKKEKIVLMICSLKAYKGVNEFVKLARMNPNFTFKLVLNATEEEIKNYFKNIEIANNLRLFPTQKNTQPFYKEASIILNLSDVDLWVETFGLTILEGMAFGLPAIVPPIGGVKELVEEGKNGFCIESKNLTLISQKLSLLLTSEKLYQEFSKYAKKKSNEFSLENFEKKSLSILSKNN